MSDDDLNDSDLEDYDVQAKAPQPLTIGFEIELFKDLQGTFYEYLHLHSIFFPEIEKFLSDKHSQEVDPKFSEFYNFNLNEQQWKLLVNKHLLMMREVFEIQKQLKKYQDKELGEYDEAKKSLESNISLHSQIQSNNKDTLSGMMPMMAIPPNMMGYSQEDHDEDDY